MNKKAFIIVCLSVLLLLLGNIVCAQTPVTIKFATYGLLEKATESDFRNVIAAFERENPDVKVEIISFPYLDLKQQVLADVQPMMHRISYTVKLQHLVHILTPDSWHHWTIC